MFSYFLKSSRILFEIYKNPGFISLNCQIQGFSRILSFVANLILGSFLPFLFALHLIKLVLKNHRKKLSQSLKKQIQKIKKFFDLIYIFHFVKNYLL